MFEELLNPVIPINIQLLDQCIQKMYQTGDEKCKEVCEFVLNRSDSFNIVLQILQGPFSHYLKIYSLIIFQRFVQFKWESLPIETRVDLRNFIAQYINEIMSTTDETISNENRQSIVRYSNIVLISILKYDWPENWINFIPNILEVSNSSLMMCANTFLILKSLAQEFTEFGEESLSSNRQGEMSSAFIDQFPLIIPVIEFALTSTDSPFLVNAVLSSLKYFIRAIDHTIIFNSKIFSTICDTLLPDIRYTINCIGVFGEIATNSFLQSDILAVVNQLFQSIVSCLGKFFPTNFAIDGSIPPFTESGESVGLNLYQVDVPKPAEFIHIFTSAMTSFVMSFQNILESQENLDSYVTMLKWLFSVTQYADTDDADFASCIQMWHSISRSIYTQFFALNLPFSPIYEEILHHLRRLAIRRMVCPNEVIYVVDQTGIHGRRESLSSQNSNLFFSMKEMMVYLTHLNHADMIAALFEKIDEICTNELFTADQINSICWSAGSLGGGALTEEEESRFFTSILEYLLQLFKSIPDINMRANVAGGIMYVCSQYTRFLSKYWEFLKVVMMKLFEFMNEMQFPEIQDSVIQSMKTIVKRCSNSLINKQPNEEMSYLETILKNAPQILSSLSLDNVVEMYEIFSILIQQIKFDKVRDEMTSLICSSLNGKENNGLMALAENIQPFDKSWFTQLLLVIKCNKKMAKFLGYIYFEPFKIIIPYLIQIYTNISEGIQRVGPGSDEQSFSILMDIKSIIVKLFTMAAKMCSNFQLISEVVLPPSVDVFLNEYESVSVGKTPEVLSLFANLSMRIQNDIVQFIPRIFNSLIVVKIPMLDDFYSNFPFWKNFVILVLALVQIPNFFLVISKEEIGTFINVLKRCCSHPQIKIFDKGLQALMDLLSVLETRTTVQFFNDFINFFGLDLMRFIMDLLTDSVHKFAFNILIGLSRKLISLNQIKSRHIDLFNMFTELFPNRPPQELNELIEKMIQFSPDYLNYKMTMRNFLISAKKFAVKDPSLYAKEKQEVEEEIKEKKVVPGLVQSSESPELQGNVQKLVDAALNFNLFT